MYTNVKYYNRLSFFSFLMKQSNNWNQEKQTKIIFCGTSIFHWCINILSGPCKNPLPFFLIYWMYGPYKPSMMSSYRSSETATRSILQKHFHRNEGYTSVTLLQEKISEFMKNDLQARLKTEAAVQRCS